MSKTNEKTAWWLKPIAAWQTELATDAKGLSGPDARSRQLKYGPNRFRGAQRQSLLLQFLSRFKNPLVILLLAASAISALTGELTNFIIISVMVLFSVTLDFVQEHRAGKAADSLRESVEVRAMLVRDGKNLEAPVTDVAPGDIALFAGWIMKTADAEHELELPAQGYAAWQFSIKYIAPPAIFFVFLHVAGIL